MDNTNFDVLLNVTGTKYGLTGDYNGNGKVDAADYVLWRKNPAYSVEIRRAITFGERISEIRPAAAAPSGVAGSAVPEPGTWVLICLGAVMLLAPRKVRSQN